MTKKEESSSKNKISGVLKGVLFFMKIRQFFYNRIAPKSHPFLLQKKSKSFLPTKKDYKNQRIETLKIKNQEVFFVEPKEDLNPDKVILYLHGGAYVFGILKYHWDFIEQLTSRLKYKVVLPDYPLAPEFSYKENIDFVLELYQQLLEKYDASQIQIMGDSAGGGLALSFSLVLKEKNLPQPNKLILLSPWMDVSMSNPKIEEIEPNDYILDREHLKKVGELYAKNTSTENPWVSPIYGALEDLPEMHLFIGTHDILLPDCRKFRDLGEDLKLNLGYYEYPLMPHCWMIFPIPESSAVVDKITSILN
jgi:monoterpene epsilon-lactone hydrolase